MNPKPNEQQQARNLYFQSDLSQQQIAELLNVNRKTLYLWIKEGGWKRIKYAAGHAPSVLIEQYYHQLGAINNHIALRDEQPWPTKDEADTIRKLTATIKQMRNGKHTLSESIEVFQVFTDKLRKKDLDLTREVMDHMDEHIKDLSDEGKFLNFSSMQREDKEVEEEFEKWLSDQIADTCQKDNHTPGNNGVQNEPPIISENQPETLSTDDLDENDNGGLSTKNNENGVTEEVVDQNKINDEIILQRIMRMPPQDRPSPYRHGNIIWVTHIDDLEYPMNNFGKPWGELKLSDIVRRYPEA